MLIKNKVNSEIEKTTYLKTCRKITWALNYWSECDLDYFGTKTFQNEQTTWRIYQIEETYKRIGEDWSKKCWK